MVSRRSVIAVLSTLLFVTLLMVSGQNVYLTILLGVFMFSLLYVVLNTNGNYFMIFYLCAFFIFLIARITATALFGMKEKAYVPLLTDDARNVTCVILSLSLISLMIGYRVKLKGFTSYRVKGLPYEVSDQYMTALRAVSKYVFYIVESVVILESLERAVYSQVFGYFESYVSYSSNIPYIVRMIADIEPVVLAVYLAAMPSKREIRGPFCFFVLGLIANVFGGTRYPLVSGILFALVYCLLRNETDSEVWIKKRTIILGVVFSPAAIVFLQFMSSWRLGGTPSYTAPIAEFMYSIGGSGYLIGYAEMYRGELASRGIIYSFGRIWKLIFANPISRNIFSTVIYPSQTANNAMYGHSFANAITYLLRPSAFLRGYGMGSSYIAELYTDFSYPGVVLGNLFIGGVIKKTRELEKNHFIKNFLCTFIIMMLLRIPRDSFDYFIVEFLGVKNILTMMILHLWAIYRAKKVTSDPPVFPRSKPKHRTHSV